MVVMCRPWLGFTWLWLFKIPGQAPKVGFGLAWPGFGPGQGFLYGNEREGHGEGMYRDGGGGDGGGVYGEGGGGDGEGVYGEGGGGDGDGEYGNERGGDGEGVFRDERGGYGGKEI